MQEKTVFSCIVFQRADRCGGKQDRSKIGKSNCRRLPRGYKLCSGCVLHKDDTGAIAGDYTHIQT